MKSLASDMLEKIKELRNLANETSKRLEEGGLSITNIPKEQLFNYNIKSIIDSIEALLRNEPSEKPILRLEKEIPDVHTNIKKLQATPQGKTNSTALSRIKEVIEYIEQNYKRL